VAATQTKAQMMTTDLVLVPVLFNRPITRQGTQKCLLHLHMLAVLKLEYSRLTIPVLLVHQAQPPGLHNNLLRPLRLQSTYGE
jgi:hypothetical protein